MSSNIQSSLCVFTLLSIIFLSKPSAASLQSVTTPDRTSKLSVCRAVRNCLKKLDVNEPCDRLPLLPGVSLTPPEGVFNVTLLRQGVWFYREGLYTSLILKNNLRLVLIDFPDSPFANPQNGSNILLAQAVEQVLEGTVPHRIDMIYSHAHFDHIGGARRFYNYAKQTFPNANFFIWGTQETKDLIFLSETKRAIQPNVIIENERELYLDKGLTIKMDIVGGHTSQDLHIFIPRHKTEPAIAMYVDTLVSGYVPPPRFGRTTDIGLYRRSQKEVLKLPFDFLVTGHGLLASRRDLQLNYKYTEDVIKAAQEAAKQSTPEKIRSVLGDKLSNPNAVEFGNVYFMFEEVAIGIPVEICYRILLEKWGCRLSGMDYVTRSHCDVALVFLSLDR